MSRTENDPGRLPRAVAVARTAELPSRDCAFLFDFDGTLSPIQHDPAASALAPGVAEALAELREVAAAVVIVSARPVAFLRQHFTDDGIALSGLYGLETGGTRGDVTLDPVAAPYVPVVAGLKEAAAELTGQGVLVEDKHASLALHYRAAPQHADLVREWATERAAEVGMRVQTGRMVVELLPPAERDKGSIVAATVAGLRCAWYLGDDVGDLAAFAALSRERERRPEFLPVRVAVANPESGGALAEAADFAVDSPAGVVGLLHDIVAGWRVSRAR